MKESVALDFILDVFATVKAEKVPPTFFLIMPAFLSLLKSELTLKEKVTRFIVNKSSFLRVNNRYRYLSSIINTFSGGHCCDLPAEEVWPGDSARKVFKNTSAEHRWRGRVVDPES